MASSQRKAPGTRTLGPLDGSKMQHAWKMGEGRAERTETEVYKRGRKRMMDGLLGGVQNFLRQLKSPDEAWAAAFAGPHKSDGDLAAFDAWYESGQHGDQHVLVAEWTDQYGIPSGAGGNYVVPFASFGWGTQAKACYWLIINHPDDHIKVARDHTAKSPVYGGASYGRNFLAHVDNDEWRRRRFGSIYTVAPAYIKQYFHKMERHAHRMSQILTSGEQSTFMYGSHKPASAFNMHEITADTAFAIAADCLFGCSDDMIAQYSRKVRWALSDADPSSRNGVAILKEWAKVNADVPAADRGPLLQALFELREDHPVDPDGKEAARDFHDDFQILSLAMHDTTGATMTFLLMELARRPEMQARVAAEARKVLEAKRGGEETRAMTYDDLYEMPLLTKCINETLRLYPAVSYGSQRMLEKDTELHCGPGPDDVTLVPKGTNVVVQNWTNHRRRDLWGEDAHDWNPDRWEGFADTGAFNFDDAGEDAYTTTYSARNPQSRRFHPFTRAPRDCFGKNFAQAEMRVMIPVLLVNHVFELAEPTRSEIASKGTGPVTYQINGILKPRDGIWMHVSPRVWDDTSPSAHSAKL